MKKSAYTNEFQGTDCIKLTKSYQLLFFTFGPQTIVIPSLNNLL